MEEKKIKEEIFKQVRKFYNKAHSKKGFIPGKTRINYSGRVFDEKEIISLVDSSLDFWLTLGERGEKFSEKFSKIVGTKNTILVNSGSSANLLAVSALTSLKLKKRIRPGDEVITVSSTFPTTCNPIVQNNLIPVFLDVELGTYNLDTAYLKKALSKKTKAVMIPHTLGNPNHMDIITEFVEENDIYLIEDCCDALDSRYGGKMCGTFGDVATFSFYPAHHITMGEGGAVVTSDDKIMRIVQSMRDWGRDCWCKTGETNSCKKRFDWKFKNLPYGYDHKYVYTHIGYNLKPLDLQASIGLEQLKKLPNFTRIRKRNFRILYKELLKLDDFFILPGWDKKSDVSWFAFPLTVNTKKFTRNEIVTWLEKQKIETRLLFSGNIIRHPAYEHVRFRSIGPLGNSDRIMKDSFFVGVYPGLTEEMMQYIAEKINEFVKQSAA